MTAGWVWEKLYESICIDKYVHSIYVYESLYTIKQNCLGFINFLFLPAHSCILKTYTKYISHSISAQLLLFPFGLYL